MSAGRYSRATKLRDFIATTMNTRRGLIKN